MNQQPDTKLIQLFKHGDRSAADELIRRYFDRVYRAAERKLNGRRVKISDADDIAISVFKSIWKRADENKFSDSDLSDSKALWRLLTVMVSNKVISHFRYESAKKRGGDCQGGTGESQSSIATALEQCPDGEFTADKLAIVREEHSRLLELLDDEILSKIAIMKMEGYLQLEIAESFGRSTKWVGRKVNIIKGIWERECEKGAEDESSRNEM